MHILFVTPGFAADEHDTTCIPSLQDLVHAYLRLYPELRLSIIALHYPFRGGSYTWHGVAVYSAGGRNSKIVKPRTWFRALHHIHRLHKQEPITTIHSFWLSESTMLGQYAARQYNVPHIATIMGQDAKSGNQYLRFINTRSLHIVALSKFAAQVFAKWTGKTVQNIIPFGVDTTASVSLNKTRDIDILGVGSVIPLKNFSLFVHIVARIRLQFPNVRALIVGAHVDSKELKHLRELIANLHLENTVELIGEVPRTVVYEYMTRSKLLLHTSIYEGQGLVLTEALHCGAYTVSFNVGYTLIIRKCSFVITTSV